MVKAIILGAFKQFVVLSKDGMNIKAETVFETMTALRSGKKKIKDRIIVRYSLFRNF